MPFAQSMTRPAGFGPTWRRWAAMAALLASGWWWLVSPVAASTAVGGDRVGRVATVVGAAQLWDAQSGQWTPLQVNRAVGAGDRVRSEGEARVQVLIGSLELFIGPRSDVQWLPPDGAAAQFRLNQGNLVVRVRTPEWVSALVMSTEELTAQPLSIGVYRLDRDTVSGGRSAAAALEGQLSLLGADIRMDVQGGQRIEVLGRGTGAGLRRTSLLQDSFAEWVVAREPLRLAGPAGVPGVQEITGLETLERHGRWESHPDMGWVWFPVNVRPGWEPYRDGRWVWVQPWGWTWVDDAPWGFAPSYYGRWVQWNSRWVWWPGHSRGRPDPIRHPAPGAGHGHGIRPGHPGLPIHPPGSGTAVVITPDRHGDVGRRDGEERTVRTPRVDAWSSSGQPRALSAPPAFPSQVEPGPSPGGSVWSAGSRGTIGTPPVAPPAPPFTAPAPSVQPAVVLPGSDRDAPVRVLPEKRHGFERPQPLQRPERIEGMGRGERPTRIEPPAAPARADGNPGAGSRTEPRSERPDRQRQIAQ